jgi:hypothetical protein
MPCTYDVDPKEEQAAWDKLKRELDETTRMLCALCACYEGLSEMRDIPGLSEWWEEHKETDAKRRKRLRAGALAKLTEDELEALGIKR